MIVEFPEDLPICLLYRLGTYPDRTGQNGGQPVSVVKAAYPRRPVSFISTSGCTDAARVCPTIPYGATGWCLLRSDGQRDWRPLKDLPAHWRPFLDRQRRLLVVSIPGEGNVTMDPRSPPCPQCGEDTSRHGQLCMRCARKAEEKRTAAAQSGGPG
jgi:hypothetical protein